MLEPATRGTQPRHRAPGPAGRRRIGRKRAGRRAGAARRASARGRSASALVAVLALPAYPLLLLWSSLAAPPDPVAAPADWAAHVLAARDGHAALLTGLGGPVLIIGVLGMAALLAGSPGRVASYGAVACAVAGTAASQPLVGLTAHAAPAAAEAVQAGTPAAAHWYAQAEAAAAPLATAGLTLSGLAWLLLGVAAWRSPRLARADGALFAVAAPLLVTAAFVPTLTPVAALLLLAGGFGVVWAAAGQNLMAWRSGSATLTTPGSPTTVR